MALGSPCHLKKFRARADNAKTQIPGARGPETEKKNITPSAMVVRKFFTLLVYALCFGRPDPQGREIAKYGGFRPFWPRTAFGTQINPGRGLKTKNHNFPALGSRSRKKISGMVVRNFLTFYILPDRTPTGGKSQNTGILGHFGLGRPLAPGEIRGAG